MRDSDNVPFILDIPQMKMTTFGYTYGFQFRYRLYLDESFEVMPGLNYKWTGLIQLKPETIDKYIKCLGIKFVSLNNRIKSYKENGSTTDITPFKIHVLKSIDGSVILEGNVVNGYPFVGIFPTLSKPVKFCDIVRMAINVYRIEYTVYINEEEYANLMDIVDDILRYTAHTVDKLKQEESTINVKQS